MTFEDWIFSIHLLFAATLVGSLVMSWIVVVSMRTADTPAATLSLYRVAMVATGATIVGLIGAIVLWSVAAIALLRSFVEYAKPVEKARALATSGQTGSSTELTALNRTSTGLLLRVLASAAIVLIVVDMIWKPGA